MSWLKATCPWLAPKRLPWAAIMLKMMWMRIKVIAGVYGLIQWHLTNEMGTTCNLISMNKIDAWILK
jgi:hypothetical protein